MRDYDSPSLTYLQARAGTVMRILVWAQARNRGTGGAEFLGLWGGAEDRTFTIGGSSRTYVGAGALMGVPPIVIQTGLSVRMQRLSLSPLSAAVADLIRTFDPRFAPIEIHRALFSTDDGALIAEPHRLYLGFNDLFEVTTPEAGGEARADMTVASSARRLTQTLPLKKSDATQQLRSGDRFRRFIDVSGLVDVWWGERRKNEGKSKSKSKFDTGFSTGILG